MGWCGGVRLWNLWVMMGSPVLYSKLHPLWFVIRSWFGEGILVEIIQELRRKVVTPVTWHPCQYAHSFFPVPLALGRVPFFNVSFLNFPIVLALAFLVRHIFLNSPFDHSSNIYRYNTKAPSWRSKWKTISFRYSPRVQRSYPQWSIHRTCWVFRQFLWHKFWRCSSSRAAGPPLYSRYWSPGRFTHLLFIFLYRCSHPRESAKLNKLI